MTIHNPSLNQWNKTNKIDYSYPTFLLGANNHFQVIASTDNWLYVLSVKNIIKPTLTNTESSNTKNNATSNTGSNPQIFKLKTFVLANFKRNGIIKDTETRKETETGILIKMNY